jgi:hypothetical protein
MTIPRPSLIILGASAGVAQALLQLLPGTRNALSGLYLVDKRSTVTHCLLDVIKRYGIPQSYVEFEYDSAFPVVDPGTPFITWSKRQFLAESVIDYSGYCGEGGNYLELDVPAIRYPRSSFCVTFSLSKNIHWE